MTGETLQFMLSCMAGPGRRISTPATYKREFVARTRLAREAAGLTRGEVAKQLSSRSGRPVVADTYRHWEKDALLPHDLIVPFCEITRISATYLLDGPVAMGRMPEPRQPPRQPRIN